MLSDTQFNELKSETGDNSVGTNKNGTKVIWPKDFKYVPYVPGKYETTDGKHISEILEKYNKKYGDNKRDHRTPLTPS